MLLLYIQAPMQQAIPPPGVQGQYGPAPGSGYPPQGYPQPQNTGVNSQGGYPMTVTPSICKLVQDNQVLCSGVVTVLHCMFCLQKRKSLQAESDI